jgi:PAS domain S-box-containing protein
MNEMVVLHEVVFGERGDVVNYRILDCNNVFTKITGIKKEDAIGKLATDVYQTETAPFLKEYSRAAITGESCEFTTYFLPMNKHFSISVVSPKQHQFATITMDVTERKKAEEEKNKYLHELEVFYKASLGREERVIELKKKIDALKEELEKCKKNAST